MTEPVAQRPPSLVGACIYLGALSAILSVRAAVVVSTWNGENRADDFDTVLGALRDAGAGRAAAESGYQVFLTVIAVLAACGAVFAFYAARGQRASRVGLTVSVVTAGAAAFLGLLGGDFVLVMIGALVVVFSIRLWTGEIRTYFRTLAGHAPPPPTVPAAVSVDPFAKPSPPAAQQAAQQPVAPPAAQPPAQYGPPPGYYGPPPGYYAAPPTPRFPRPVSIAVWTTFIGSIVVAGVSALGLLALGLIGDDYEQMMRDSPLNQSLLDRTDMSYDQLYRSSLTVLGLCLALSLGGLVSSILVLVKRRSGDVFLFVMAVVTIIASFVLLPIGVPWLAAAIVVVVQLRKAESRAWFSQT